MVSDGTRKSTVWMIDDSEETARAVESMLAPIECDPHAFSSAREATQALLGRAQSDLMRLEVNMPEIGGLESLELMHRCAESKDRPVVMISRESAGTLARRTLDLAADGHITKPIALEEPQSLLSVSVRKGQKGQLWQ